MGKSFKTHMTISKFCLIGAAISMIGAVGLTGMPSAIFIGFAIVFLPVGILACFVGL